MKIDLDDLVAKARAATQGEWAADRVPGLPRDDEPIMANVIALELDDRGRQQQIADCYDNTNCPDERCEANAAHIAAASPPVVLALIARVRLLKRTVDQAAALLEAGSDKAARREWARKIREYVADDKITGEADRLEAIAKAATAFVDEQGKRVDVDRGYTIGLPEDFAASAFEELVRAVEGAGR